MDFRNCRQEVLELECKMEISGIDFFLSAGIHPKNLSTEVKYPEKNLAFEDEYPETMLLASGNTYFKFCNNF